MKKVIKIVLAVVVICGIPIMALIVKDNQNYVASLKKGVYVKNLADSELTAKEKDPGLFDGDTYILVKATDGKMYHAVLMMGHQKQKLGDSVSISDHNNGSQYLVK